MAEGPPPTTREPCTFADKLGRVWTLEINVITVGRLRRELQFDIYTVLDDKLSLLTSMASDLGRLVSVLACVLEESLETQGVKPEDFGRSFNQAAIEDGLQAVIEAITDFFRGRPVGDVLRGAIGKANEVVQSTRGKALTGLRKGLDAIDPDTVADELLKSLIDAQGSPA
jgi:hypothetical protein